MAKQILLAASALVAASFAGSAPAYAESKAEEMKAAVESCKVAVEQSDSLNNIGDCLSIRMTSNPVKICKILKTTGNLSDVGATTLGECVSKMRKSD